MKIAPQARNADPVAAVFLAIAGVCAAFAYVGLSASGYWIDELFTLFLIDHRGGEAEVLRRALTDTHPPVFYFLAYPWLRLFGSDEAPMRAFSATLMVASLPLLFVLLRRAYSLRAAAFGVAVAASSKLFFEQSQNVRNYPLTVFFGTIIAGLALAIRRRAAAGTPVPVWMAAAFWLTGLLGSFTHFYLFLAVGAVHLYLLINLKTLKQRVALVFSGGSIFAPVAAYAVILTRGSQQDVEDMWFSNDFIPLSKQMLNGLSQAWSWAAIGAIVVLAVAALLRHGTPAAASERSENSPQQREERRAAAQLSGLTILLVIAAGLTVSFVVAPSFGARNLVVLAPFFWILAASLYDAASPDLGRMAGKAVTAAVIVLLLANVANLRGRFLVRAEAFRESADLVAAEAACAGQTIPAVLPDLFGPPTPFFRDLARNSFYGRYFPAARVSIVTPDEFAKAKADPAVAALWRARMAGGCPILAWGVHDLDLNRAEGLAADLADTAGVDHDKVRIRTVKTAKMVLAGATKTKATAFIFERAP